MALSSEKLAFRCVNHGVKLPIISRVAVGISNRGSSLRTALFRLAGDSRGCCCVIKHQHKQQQTYEKGAHQCQQYGGQAMATYDNRNMRLA